MKYSVIASTFSGNKGGASMLEASIQTISARDNNAEFYVFTVYPEVDEKFNHYKNVQILSGKPLLLGLLINPLALMYKIIPPLRPLLRKQKFVKAIADSDVFLDQGGITFVDGRDQFLIYNVATILPALFIGTPVIKCSQAMGPFNSKLNRFCAKILLPQVDTICARGDITYQHLKSLGLNNVIESTDYAFLMEIEAEEKKNAGKLLKKHSISDINLKNTIVVMPSEVVRKKSEAKGEDYIGFNTRFIKYLINNGHNVLLLAYSARKNTESRHNNDLLVCRSIAEGVDNEKFIFIDDELSAQVLRHIIGKSRLVVTSRFHAMVAALSMEVPPLVIGWSHKYAEIMSMFGLKDSALGSEKLDDKKFQQTFDKLYSEQKVARELIKKNLIKVKKSAQRQVDAIIRSQRQKDS